MLASISLAPEVTKKFTPDMKYLCACMGTPAPLLPVHGEKEYKLFAKLLRGECSDLNFDNMALVWCRYVDGKGLFPKPPVHLRTHHKTWERNERAREAVRTAAAGEVVLGQINERPLQELAGNPAASAPAPTPTCRGGGGTSVGGGAGAGGALAATPRFLPPPQHPPISPSAFPPQGGPLVVVEGMAVGGEPPLVREPRGNGQRQKDAKKRKPRKWRGCLSSGRGGVAALACRGRAFGGTCQYS